MDTIFETAETIDERIRTAAERAGLEFVRVARVRGRAAAVFTVWRNDYGKTFATREFDDESQLLREVLDTLEHPGIGGLDVNIFSSEMFEFLVAEMLPTDGRAISLTIAGVVEKTVAGPRGEQMKVIISFVERPKKLILNKTNARALARALGSETDNWRGATVTLGVEQVKVGKNVVPSIRVKSATPAAPPKQQQPPAQPSQTRSRANRPATTPGDDPALRDAPADDGHQTGMFG